MVKLLTLSLVAAMCVSSTLSAQVNPAPPATDSPTRGELRKQIRNEVQQRLENARDREGTVTDGRVVERGENTQLNGQLADCLLLHSQEEITLARFALEHSQNPKVKEFAQQMINDHQKMNQSLMRFALHGNAATTDQRGVDNRTTPNSTVITPAAPVVTQNDPAIAPGSTNPRNDALNSDRNRDGRRDAAPSADTRREERIQVRAGYAGVNDANDQTWYQIERQAAENCTQMTKELLSKEKGEHFDHAFVGVQIGGHINMLAQLKAAEPHVSGEFQQVLREGIQTVTQHKQHAETLKADLMKGTASNTNASEAM